jgi:hypothetical protein
MQLGICGIAAVIAISAKGVCMRVKDVFSVFPRKLRSGKVVFYYQCMTIMATVLPVCPPGR